jgi:hypothetical protein
VDVGRLVAKSAQLATFLLGKGAAVWSEDERALHVPVLRLEAHVTRQLATGALTAFERFNGVELRIGWEGPPVEISYVWGDFALVTSRPEIHDVLLLRGKVRTPNVDVILRYRKELVKDRSRRL